MSEALCRACSSWLCASDDAFCGACGNPCASLQLVALPSVLQIGHIAPKIALKLTNPSCATLSINRIVGPNWLTINGTPISGPIGPGETKTFLAVADTFGMKKPDSGEVSIDTSAGRALLRLLAIEETPTLLSSPSELQIWFDHRNERKQVDLTIAPASGYLQIRSIRPAARTGALSIIETPKNVFLASPGMGAPVTVEIDSVGAQDKQQAQLLVDYDDAHGVKTIRLPLSFVVRNPPELRWTGEHDPPEVRYQTSGQKLRFVFTNQSETGSDGGLRNGVLRVDRVSLSPPAQFSAVPIRLTSLLPAEVHGGDSYQAEFELNLEPLPARDQPYHFTLDVTSNRPTLKKRVAVIVRTLAYFDGVIAIDFGTSNTCCAVLERGQQTEGLGLDDGNVVAPTIVRYLDLSGDIPVISTGARVKELAAISEKVAASTVSRLKQQLGEAAHPVPVRPESSEEWTTRLASDAASDYLLHIRKTAETEKNAIFRQFILTHPAVCSLRQYRNLRTALLHAFGKNATRINFLQEPIAALVPFFSEMAQKPAQPGYSVAAFDLGGGTTDITVVRVNHSWRSSEHVDISPEIVVSWGERFGGEDLTDYLVSELVARCKRILSVEQPGAQFTEREVRGASTADIRRNIAALREAAERFKASLSEEGNLREPDLLTVRVMLSGADRSSNFDIDFRKIRRAGNGDLQTEFLLHVRTNIERLAKRLQKSASAIGSLDYIQLSGKTTFLPVVRDVTQSMFSKTIIVRAPDPKECVVRGACLSRSMAQGSMRRLLLTDVQRTTSSLGVVDEDSDTFYAIIPVDKPIPAQGLEATLPNYWNGEDSVVIWENLSPETKGARFGDLARSLAKLGTWETDRLVPVSSASRWGLRLTLRDFELAVSAVSPDDGQLLPFRPISAGVV